MKRFEIDKKLDQIVDFSGVEQFIDTPVKRYSSGMYVRLAFAVAAHLESEILVVDEVLAVGDVQFQRKCLGKLRDVSRDGRTVLFVSHSMTAISALCSRALMLVDGRLIADGPSAEVIARYYATGAAAADQTIDLRAVARSGTGKARFTELRVQCMDAGRTLDAPLPGCD